MLRFSPSLQPLPRQETAGFGQIFWEFSLIFLAWIIPKDFWQIQEVQEGRIDRDLRNFIKSNQIYPSDAAVGTPNPPNTPRTIAN